MWDVELWMLIGYFIIFSKLSCVNCVDNRNTSGNINHQQQSKTFQFIRASIRSSMLNSLFYVRTKLGCPMPIRLLLTDFNVYLYK